MFQTCFEISRKIRPFIPISQENAPIFRSVKLVKFPAMSQLLVKIHFLLIALKEIYWRVEVLPPNLGESSPNSKNGASFTRPATPVGTSSASMGGM
jgi:hypothetical protein